SRGSAWSMTNETGSRSGACIGMTQLVPDLLYTGAGWQQPVMQYVPAGQQLWPGWPHGWMPRGHCSAVQSGGGVGLPRQTSQGSHAFQHDGTGEHGWHFEGSPITSIEHVGVNPLASYESR